MAWFNTCCCCQEVESAIPDAKCVYSGYVESASEIKKYATFDFRKNGLPITREYYYGSKHFRYYGYLQGNDSSCARKLYRALSPSTDSVPRTLHFNSCAYVELSFCTKHQETYIPTNVHGYVDRYGNYCDNYKYSDDYKYSEYYLKTYPPYNITGYTIVSAKISIDDLTGLLTTGRIGLRSLPSLLSFDEIISKIEFPNYYSLSLKTKKIKESEIGTVQPYTEFYYGPDCKIESICENKQGDIIQPCSFEEFEKQILKREGKFLTPYYAMVFVFSCAFRKTIPDPDRIRKIRDIPPYSKYSTSAVNGGGVRIVYEDVNHGLHSDSLYGSGRPLEFRDLLEFSDYSKISNIHSKAAMVFGLDSKVYQEYIYSILKPQYDRANTFAEENQSECYDVEKGLSEKHILPYITPYITWSRCKIPEISSSSLRLTVYDCIESISFELEDIIVSLGNHKIDDTEECIDRSLSPYPISISIIGHVKLKEEIHPDIQGWKKIRKNRRVVARKSQISKNFISASFDLGRINRFIPSMTISAMFSKINLRNSYTESYPYHFEHPINMDDDGVFRITDVYEQAQTMQCNCTTYYPRALCNDYTQPLTSSRMYRYAEDVADAILERIKATDYTNINSWHRGFTPIAWGINAVELYEVT